MVDSVFVVLKFKKTKNKTSICFCFSCVSLSLFCKTSQNNNILTATMFSLDLVLPCFHFFFFLCSDFFDLVLICQIHIFTRAFMNERQSCHMCFSEQMIKAAALGCLCGWKKDVKAACVGLFCFGQRMKLFTLKWTC